MADILVIDDDPQMRRALISVLKRMGHVVHEASSGNEGITRFQQTQPALVVCDIVMPDGEGIQTIQALRRQAPSVPILAISGVGARGLYLRAATALGAAATLEKPFSAQTLRATIKDLLKAVETDASAGSGCGASPSSK